MNKITQPQKAATVPLSEALKDREFFLSATNPAATKDQRDLEQLALKVMATPEIAQARKGAEFQWLSVTPKDISEQNRSLFDGMITEYLFANVLKAVNSDVNYPKVVCNLYGPPHEWFGMEVPGTRIGGDCPDNYYAAIPIDPAARTEIYGEQIDPVPADFNANLFAAVSFRTTLDIITGTNLVVNDDGSFVITLDPEPANGRPNHIQTRPDGTWLFIRQTRGDWNQVPRTLRVRRLDPPAAPPISFEQIVKRAVEYIADDVPNTYWWMAMSLAIPANKTTGPFSTKTVGGLVSQSAGFGHVVLQDDEALIITVGNGGAGFRDIVLLDYWYRTIHYDTHTSSFTDRQGRDNGDGTTTYVVSLKDPGVYNWLDPVGLHETHLVFRWQLLPLELPEGEVEPFIKTELVKFDALESVLSASVPRAALSDRQSQLEERSNTYRKRYVDC